ncbi:MAG: phosphatidylinositol-specific phospholipase C/glycerophosphodiester phosphodiesterase family protein [Verrucomicrobiales bacterium]|nr:phosphatidylinositol-specific phospholipase C/glycerophosphodiester phosphodiesterase family protein [Verrucomicrobiales bacterium]
MTTRRCLTPFNLGLMVIVGAFLTLSGFGLPAAPAAEAVKLAGSPQPLIQAHSHNDYEQARPLQDALALGFCNVEADIYLVEGKLLVAHDRQDVRPDRTLEGLYLDPLRARVRRNGGRVYPEKAPFTLLIDIKEDAEKVYPVLDRLLRRYRGMLTSFTADSTRTGAVTVVLSGDRPIRLVEQQKRRWCGIDGRLKDLETNPSPHLFPWVSDNWVSHFTWRGEGEISTADWVKLQAVVAKAHAQNRRLRFWATGNDPRGWKVLQRAGVDLLGADDLAGLHRWLTDSVNHGTNR